jgi:hypothetical protein
LVQEAKVESLLVVEVEQPGPGKRGQLALHIEESIEEVLARHGAAPPGFGASVTLDASLSDQLYRARLVELRGLALSLPSLEGLAGLGGSLDAEDSAVIRWWMATTRERPVRLFLDEANAGLGVYGPPRPLATVLGELYAAHVTPRTPAVAEAPSPAPELRASSAAMELSSVPPRVAESLQVAPVEVERREPLLLGRAMAAVLSELATGMASTEPAGEQLSLPLAEPVSETPEMSDQLVQAIADDYAPNSSGHEPEQVGLDDAWFDEMIEHEAIEHEAIEHEATEHEAIEPEAIEPEAVEPEALEPELEAAALQVEQAAEPGPHRPAPIDREEGKPAPSSPVAPQAPSIIGSRASENWRAWLRDLEVARGPKPLAVVERMFVSNYTPLRDAVARGLDDPNVHAVLDSWATSFAESYSDAFDALRLRGKRPTMVLDVPDIALRIGRLHGARSVQLILVDGMRFDLGLRIQDRLSHKLGARAALTERLLLWSALPSTTMVQVELIGRGPHGLRDLSDACDSEVPVARGRAAATLRRIKAGHRDLMKLDLVEARMSEPGGPLGERLDTLADEVAEVLEQHMAQLQPRTLVMVFGDHGFVTEALDRGTSAGRQGGALPEEVLVPGFAWLVGNMH